MRVLYDRVAAIDVHKDMVKVAIRVPGAKRGTRKTDVLEFRTFYGVLQEMARELRRRGVTHVVMEASGVYTDPVYYALRELDFEEVMVINPAHAKALKGHKTDAKDAIRLLDLYECGLLSGSYMPDPDLREVRDLARYRMKTVQARISEIQRLQKALETAGIKLDSVVSDITGGSATAMIEALISGERRGSGMAGLAQTRLRTAGKMADLSMALAGRFTDHHALMCRLHLDRIKLFDDAVKDLDARIAPKVACHDREAGLLKSLPGRLQARFRRLVRKFGGPRNKGAQKRAITAIAHTLLKIAYSVLKTGKPYADLGADFYTRRESPDARQDYLMRQLQKLNPGCVITITPAEAA